MINNNKIKYWARNKLFAAGFDSSEFAWPNRTFDSSNADIYFIERMNIANETINASESNVKDGLLFYDVVGQKGVGDDILDTSAQAIAQIFDPWNNKEQVIDASTKIDIDVATTGDPGDYEESRYLIPVRIEFRAYEYFDPPQAGGVAIGSEDILLSNAASTGTRGYALDTTSERSPSEVESIDSAGYPVIGSFGGATNFVSSDVLNDWSANNVTKSGTLQETLITSSVGSNLQYIEQIGAASSDSKQIITFAAKPNGVDYLLVRLSALTSTFVTVKIDDGTVTGPATGLTASNVRWRNLGEGWYEISVFSDSISAGFVTPGVFLSDGVNIPYNGDGVSGVYIRHMRAMQGVVSRFPRFQDGSPRSESYGTDGLSFSYTYSSAFGLLMRRKAYDWSDSDNPVDPEPVIYQAGSFEVRVNASGFIETSGGAVSTQKSTADTEQDIYVYCDGVNHTISVDGETPVVAASAILPTGSTTYYLNNSSATKADQATAVGIVYNRDVQEDERTSVFSVLPSDWETI